MSVGAVARLAPKPNVSVDFFLNEPYQRHNRRRQEHLASLHLPLAGRSVLEVGAGIGDHTSFFLDRGCRVTLTDARAENLAFAERRHPAVATRLMDLDGGGANDVPPHDVVYAYGVLYHLRDPARGLDRMAALSAELLLLETCVSFGADFATHPVAEDVANPTQSACGIGCRPTRAWVFRALGERFEHVYVTTTQPWHDEFPLDWTAAPPPNATGLYRSVFVASRRRLDSPWLSDRLLERQTR